MSTGQEIQAKIKSAIEDVRRKALKITAVEAEKSVRRNFDSGGRPKWTPRKRISKKQRGTNILVISGALKNVSATIDEGASKVTLTTDPRARKYAKIQNEGGTITIPARKIKLRRTKNKSGKEVSRFAGKQHKRFETKEAKAHKIEIPARPFMVIPKEDHAGILNAIKTGIHL